MFRKSSSGKVVAVALIDSGSAALALLKLGGTPELLAHAREDLPLEDRSKDALRSGVLQALASAGEKLLAEYAASGKRETIAQCYCIIAAPWTRSFAASARSSLESPAAITDDTIRKLAKQALADQHDIDRVNLLEASVSRILLNGYPTPEPAGKRAKLIDVTALASDCDADIKRVAAESLSKLFPGVTLVWRSAVRADLEAIKCGNADENCLIVEVGGEATDLISLHKGSFDQRLFVERGVRQLLSALAKGRPAAETMTLMEMIEKDECDDAACEELRQSIAKTEPDLVHLFGEAMAKLSARRKLPDSLVLIAPPALAPWLSRFFARIDFTQFTATAKPFSVETFSAASLPGAPASDPSILADPALCIACNLVNNELSS